MQMIGDMVTERRGGAIINIVKLATTDQTRLKITVTAKPIGFFKRIFHFLRFPSDMNCEVVFSSDRISLPLSVKKKVSSKTVVYEGMTPRFGALPSLKDPEKEVETISDVCVFFPESAQGNWDVKLKIAMLEN